MTRRYTFGVVVAEAEGEEGFLVELDRSGGELVYVPVTELNGIGARSKRLFKDECVVIDGLNYQALHTVARNVHVEGLPEYLETARELATNLRKFATTRKWKERIELARKIRSLRRQHAAIYTALHQSRQAERWLRKGVKKKRLAGYNVLVKRSRSAGAFLSFVNKPQIGDGHLADYERQFAKDRQFRKGLQHMSQLSDQRFIRLFFTSHWLHTPAPGRHEVILMLHTECERRLQEYRDETARKRLERHLRRIGAWLNRPEET